MEEDYVMIPGSGTKKIIRDVKKEIETAFLDYSMSVIVSRALPDVRDGLKPVHRRILYTMHERGNDPSHAYRKSADNRDVELHYCPGSRCKIQSYKIRISPHIMGGQGNFGSMEMATRPPAVTVTRVRMSRMAVEMLSDITNASFHHY